MSIDRMVFPFEEPDHPHGCGRTSRNAGSQMEGEGMTGKTEYRYIQLNAGTGYNGGASTIYGAACLTCGATLFGDTHPFPSEGAFTLTEATTIHSAWHQATT